MKKIALIFSLASMLLLGNCKSGNETKNKTNMETNVVTSGKVIHITTAEFKKQIYNYDVNKDWKFEGNKPCIIDFYADWCGPCKMVSPILEELAKEYDGKITIYKVDTDKESDLAQTFGISSIPTILFVPMQGQPQAAMGALPKDSFKKAISDVLKVK